MEGAQVLDPLFYNVNKYEYDSDSHNDTKSLSVKSLKSLRRGLQLSLCKMTTQKSIRAVVTLLRDSYKILKVKLYGWGFRSPETP